MPFVFNSPPVNLHWLEVALVAGWSIVLLTTILNTMLVPRLHPQSGRYEHSDQQPTVSILVPARNEERTIEQTVRGLLGQTYAPLEVIVVDDRSTDATGATLARIAAEDPRLTVVHGEEPPAGWLGKPWALDQASRRARGDLLLFVDADVHYAPEAVGTFVARLLTSGVAMLSIVPRFEMRGFWEHVGVSGLPTFGMLVVPIWLANRTTIAQLGIGGGPGNLLRRGAFEEIGGYAAVRDAVIDDIGMARHIRARGHRTELVLADTLASIRMYRGLREIVNGFTKNVFAAFGRSYVLSVLALIALGIVDFAPYLLALRGDLLAIVAVLLISAARLIAFARLRYRLDNAVLGFPISQLLWGFILVRSMWVTGIRGQVRWRGRAYGGRWTRFGSGR